MVAVALNWETVEITGPPLTLTDAQQAELEDTWRRLIDEVERRAFFVDHIAPRTDVFELDQAAKSGRRLGVISLDPVA